MAKTTKKATETKAEDKAEDKTKGPTKENKGVIGAAYREKYGKARSNEDDIANTLAEFVTDDKSKNIDQDKLWDVAKQNDIDMNKYAHLNVGMQRMNLGNRLRGLRNKGIDVKIGKAVIKGEEKAPKTKTKKKEPADEQKAA